MRFFNDPVTQQKACLLGSLTAVTAAGGGTLAYLITHGGVLATASGNAAFFTLWMTVVPLIFVTLMVISCLVFCCNNEVAALERLGRNIAL
ncbi:MAG: hypothetical protein K0S27_1367 [Gammaproteobacteria bacterium]|jgi:hypothetical protein|nr:hypothetical protein [Gammaproteobacteria bacterium]